MDRDYKYNAERYYDPTAYAALNNVQKGKNMDNNDCRIGEIWEITNKSSIVSYKGLVIADNGNVVTFIKLVDEQTDKSDIEVICQGRVYGCSRMIQHTFTQYCEEFHRKLRDEEFQEIKAKVAKSLGIESKVVTKEVEVEKVVYKEPEEVSDMEWDIELERTKAQLEVYKGLYESLMQKMVG